MPPGILPDYLRPGLKLVFVGFNPSPRSAQRGHYYAGRGNQFWPFLHEAGFTNVRLYPEDDHRILTYNIGLTDIVKTRATPGISDLTDHDYTAGFDVLRKKMRRFRPQVVCFNGKSGYARIARRRCDYGLQPDAFAGAILFLAPSTSGALPMPRAEKLRHYQNLKTLVEG